MGIMIEADAGFHPLLKELLMIKIHFNLSL